MVLSVWKALVFSHALMHSVSWASLSANDDLGVTVCASTSFLEQVDLRHPLQPEVDLT